VKVLELYAGIGGFSAAAQPYDLEIIAAVDASQHALEALHHNFGHAIHQISLMGDVAAKLRDFDAEMWWMSPPCTPHTRRGLKKDLDDPRAETFEATLAALEKVRPPLVGFENVEGFVGSDAQRRLHEAFDVAGYQFAEVVVCASALGMPNRRPRYYAAAALGFMPEFNIVSRARRPLAEFIVTPSDPKYVPEHIQDKYGGAMLRVKADDPEAETACFTSAYGQSWVFSGSYLETSDGLRLFGDQEIAALLGFSADFCFPHHFGRRQRWKLLGNSLSIPAVREVLRALRIAA
jgi:site-specific DNA-cytosine methylase